MRYTIAAIASLVLCLGAAARADEPQPKFRVHEWGVHIRSLARVSSALALGGGVAPEREPNWTLQPPRALLDGLPGFVLRHDKEYTPKKEYRNWNKPVIHFYGADGNEVTVEIKTPQGRPIAYWPKPALVEETLWYMGSGVTDTVAMRWKGKLLARAKEGQLRDVPAGHWWSAVREVPGLYLQTEAGAERFLFYEAFALQGPTLTGAVTAEAITLSNSHTAASGTVIIILNDAGKRHFAVVKDVAAAGKVKLTREELLRAEGDGNQLMDVCRRQWESFGMSGAEANAIVQTWKDDLLDRPGFLVISAIPAPLYDAMFPLSIEPKPAEIVRVGMVFDALVGQPARADWLPELRTAMQGWARELSADEFKARRRAADRLAQAGDLARPILEGLKNSKEAEASAAAKTLLEQLEPAAVSLPPPGGRGGTR